VRNAAWAVVPLKSPAAAKSRLREALDAGARQRLMLCMARHVVHTLVGTPGIAGVAVVTASPEIAALVKNDGAIVIRQDRDDGTAAACRVAADVLSGTATSVLMISGDIPLIHAAAVAELVELARRTPVVAIVPDRGGKGTNALLIAPPAVIEPCFGPDSFRRHVAATRARGVELRIVESDALSLDIDDVEDLDELRRRLERDACLLPAELREAVPRKERVPAQ
jgi:2-phospho-L-lactate guanylyltransferase